MTGGPAPGVPDAPSGAAMRDLRPARPLRLVHVYFHTDVGGIESRLLELLPRFDRARFEPHLVCIRRRGSRAALLERKGVAVHRCRCSSRLPGWVSARRLARSLRRLGAEIVHAHAEVPSLHATDAARRAGVPVVVANYHTMDLFPRRAQLRRERRLAAERDGTIHVSRAVLEGYRRRVGSFGNSESIIYNGIDVAAFGASIRPAREAALRRELEIGDRGPVLLTVARLQRVKAHRDLLAALPAVREGHPGVVLLLAGDGRRRSEIEAAARSLGVAGAVRFLGLRDDVRDLYQLADVHVLSSLREGFSTVVLEAMAAGVPQVLTDVGGNREAVHDSGAARLVPAGDPEVLARALAEVLDDRRLATEMGRAARERAQRFSVDEQVRRTEALYLELARRKGIGAAGARG